MRHRTPITLRPARIRGVVHIHVERCKGCKLCISYCPTKVLTLSSDFNAKGYHYPIAAIQDDCINCRACATICPDFAIFSSPAPSDERLQETVLST